MKRRTRFFAGLFAFVAMTAALAEGVVASACASGMQMNDAAMALSEGMSHGGDCIIELAERGERNDLPDDGRHCPFAPVASTQGCLAVVSFPASGFRMAESSADAGSRIVFDDEQHHLLLETALFHPPRT